MTPIEYFTSLFGKISVVSTAFGLAILDRYFKNYYWTYCVYLAMFAAVPLIIYTVVTYNMTIALRALTVVGGTIQV